MCNITSGIPRASQFVQLLSNTYDNDINLIDSDTLFFADDIKLFRVIRIRQDTELFLNDLDNFSN